MSQTVLILGASARAAMQSAARAGLKCRGIDLFADRDARQLGEVAAISDYPHEFAQAAAQMPPGPWMYAGGLENYPKLVDAIARRRPLWGIAGDVLRRVRNPLMLRDVLQTADLPTPKTVSTFAALPRDEVWLRKPLRSCGGAGIVNAAGWLHSAQAGSSGSSYFQEFVAGRGAAAVFCAEDDKTQFVGLTQQLIGAPWTGAREFQYAGSVGPLIVSANCQAQIRRIGALLAEAFQLRGIFGVDGILRGDDFFTVEVNPRYTASVEVLERAGAPPALALHAAAFGIATEGPRKECAGRQEAIQRRAATPAHGKAIVYADADVRIGKSFADFIARQNRAGGEQWVADIPRTGLPIKTGSPVATVFAAGANMADVERRLRQRAAALRHSLDSAHAAG